MQNTKDQKTIIKTKGITLIALVITIIIMLILVGVSIGAISGDKGILKKTLTAKVKDEIAKIEENIQLYNTDYVVDKYANGNEEYDIYGYLYEKNLITEEEKNTQHIIRDGKEINTNKGLEKLGIIINKVKEFAKHKDIIEDEEIYLFGINPELNSFATKFFCKVNGSEITSDLGKHTINNKMAPFDIVEISIGNDKTYAFLLNESTNKIVSKISSELYGNIYTVCVLNNIEESETEEALYTLISGNYYNGAAWFMNTNWYEGKGYNCDTRSKDIDFEMAINDAIKYDKINYTITGTDKHLEWNGHVLYMNDNFEKVFPGSNGLIIPNSNGKWNYNFAGRDGNAGLEHKIYYKEGKGIAIGIDN